MVGQWFQLYHSLSVTLYESTHPRKWGASCCFIEPSCKKGEIFNLFLPVKTDTVKIAMGDSLVLCWSFWTLLVWGCKTTVCLVDDKLTVEPAATAAHLSTEPVNANGTYGTACGNRSEICMEFCKICNSSEAIMDCIYYLLDALCLKSFKNAMDSRSRNDWCNWANVSGLYSHLSLCTEGIFDCFLVPWPNHFVERKFVEIHTRFFKDCPTEELSDPPPAIVFALVITPICLIPVMVSLVVLKTKNGDGSS